MLVDILQSIGIDATIVLTIAGIAILYFGRIISETKVEKYDHLGYYLEGLFFVLLYVALPFALVYKFGEVIALSPSAWIFVQIGIFALLWYNLVAQEYLRRYGLLENVRKNVRERLNRIVTENKLVGGIIKKNVDYFVNVSILAFYGIPTKLFGNKFTLLVFSALAMLSNFSAYQLGDILILGISLGLTFFILTAVALSYGYRSAHYPRATFYLNNGKAIEGKVLKFGEFTHIVKGDKKIFINKDSISHFEMSLSKEKDDSK